MINVTSQTDILTNLLSALNFQQPVESFILLTPQEKAQLDANTKSVGWVTPEKLLTIYKPIEIPSGYEKNREILFEKASKFEKAYGYELDFTSVFRAWSHHVRVYQTINSARKSVGLEPLKVPTGSKHLYFQAFDCKPKNKPISHLHDFVRDEKVLKELQIWCEGLKQTPSWLHCQSVPYPSFTTGKSHFFNI